MQQRNKPTETAQESIVNVQLPDIDYLKALADTAKAYIANGQSVVPVWGNLQQGKASKIPPIKWERYQNELASPTEADEWFLGSGYGGLALVLGRISDAMAIEFDTPDLAALFATEHPDLADTHTTLSGGKGLPHYRIRPPAGAGYNPAGKFGIMELRGEGQYVVISPTITQAAYRVIRGGEPRRYTTEQWERLHAFIQKHTSASQSPRPAIQVNERPGDHPLITYYLKRIAIRGSRALAFMDAACQARDNRISRAELESVLLATHISQPPVTAHAEESPNQRRAEAMSILKDVYNRAARQPSKSLQSRAAINTPGLPTSARESLLQADCAGLARVLDALYLSKWNPGQAFTERQAVDTCKSAGISRKVVRAALQHEKGLFAKAEKNRGSEDASAPQNGSGAASAARADQPAMEGKIINVPELHSNNPNTTTFGSKGAKRGQKSKAGRPPASSALYILPTIETVCSVLKVPNVGSDPLTLADVGSVKKYREAINRALLERRPGKYRKATLAQRLGVKGRTMHTYLKGDKRIRTTPTYQAVIQLTRENYQTVIDREVELNDYGKPKFGVWVEVDKSGLRYPAIKAIVERLLQKHWLVELVKQGCNYYEVEGEAGAIALPLAAGAENLSGQPVSTPAQDDDYDYQNLFSRAIELGAEIKPLSVELTDREKGGQS